MKPIKLYKDLSIPLYIGETDIKRGVSPTPPTPITYLTQWKIVGNSEVHGVGNLTSWKVSGNSVVSNNTIMSCGDLGQDGKYHVKISNGVTIYDISLTEPLRKVNDVADTIEFSNGSAVITRYFKVDLLTNASWFLSSSSNMRASDDTWASEIKAATSSKAANILIEGFTTYSYNEANTKTHGYACSETQYVNRICLYDASFIGEGGDQAFSNYIVGKHIIFELATPTTELVDVSSFPVSPTDTYTSANVVPYSAFEHTENKEIWSCGEYSEIDNKYHIVVLPQGKSPVDIALDAPLRKVNDVADTIEFPSNTDGKALVTRNLKSVDMGTLNWYGGSMSDGTAFSTNSITDYKYGTTVKALCAKYALSTQTYYSATQAYSLMNDKEFGFGYYSQSIFLRIYIKDLDYESPAEIKLSLDGVELIYELATPTTELVDAPQIAEADSYSMVISQGGKAVEWSSFETE